MKQIKEYEALKSELSNAEKFAQKHLANADVKEKTSLKTVLNAIRSAEIMADNTINSMIEAEKLATIEAEKDRTEAIANKKSLGKTIKVISHRRLRINGGILKNKEIADIPNNDVAKQCLKSGLISMI